jgi:hypothetical protein
MSLPFRGSLAESERRLDLFLRLCALDGEIKQVKETYQLCSQHMSQAEAAGPEDRFIDVASMRAVEPTAAVAYHRLAEAMKERKKLMAKVNREPVVKSEWLVWYEKYIPECCQISSRHLRKMYFFQLGLTLAIVVFGILLVEADLSSYSKLVIGILNACFATLLNKLATFDRDINQIEEQFRNISEWHHEAGEGEAEEADRILMEDEDDMTAAWNNLPRDVQRQTPAVVFTPPSANPLSVPLGQPSVASADLINAAGVNYSSLSLEPPSGRSIEMPAPASSSAEPSTPARPRVSEYRRLSDPFVDSLSFVTFDNRSDTSNNMWAWFQGQLKGKRYSPAQRSELYNEWKLRELEHRREPHKHQRSYPLTEEEKRDAKSEALRSPPPKKMSPSTGATFHVEPASPSAGPKENEGGAHPIQQLRDSALAEQVTPADGSSSSSPAVPVPEHKGGVIDSEVN